MNAKTKTGGRLRMRGSLHEAHSDDRRLRAVRSRRVVEAAREHATHARRVRSRRATRDRRSLAGGSPGEPLVADYFDFSIYVHAEEALVRGWFLERFHRLRATAFRDPASYFHRYAALTDDEATAFAERVWNTINQVNLRENIAPTRERATLVLEKGADHRIASVALRRP